MKFNGRGLLGLYNNEISFLIRFVLVEKLLLTNLAMTPQTLVFVIKVHTTAYYGVDFRNTCLCMSVLSLWSKSHKIYNLYSSYPQRCILSQFKLAKRFSRRSKNVQLLTLTDENQLH